MTALSIRNMNYTLARRSQEGEMATRSAADSERAQLWVFERKNNRGNKWSTVGRSFLATKSRAGELWIRHFKSRTDGKYRLRRIAL